MTENDEDRIVLRPATMNDWPLLLKWRNDPATRAASRSQQVIDEATHREWLQRCLADDRRSLLVAERASCPVGTVRLDFDEECELSWTVAPEFRGQGIGSRMVRLVVASVSTSVRAEARRDNPASCRIAERAGLTESEQNGDWIIFRRGPVEVSEQHA